MTTAVAALTFGIAAFSGALLAAAVCRDAAPFPDGPLPTKVSPLLVAVFGAVVGAAVSMHGASALQLGTLALITVALSACSVSDLNLGIVPDLFTLVPLGAIIISSGLHSDFGPLFSGVIVAVPLAIAAMLSRGLGMGWGDVKLAALGGSLLGAGGATLAFIIGCLVACLLSFIKGRRGQPIALAPYLVGGIGAVLMMGTTV